jgi:NADH-quinone oxidoreductase subunit C
VTPEETAERVRRTSPDVVVARGEVTVSVSSDQLLPTLAALGRDTELDLGFLSCVTAIDYPGTDPRFWVTYELRSLEKMHRVRVRVGVGGADPHIPSVTSIFPTADWLERETFDLYGIVFDGHPGLTRILMPEDWEGYPLRKDEELGGVPTRYHGALVPPIDKRGMA